MFLNPLSKFVSFLLNFYWIPLSQVMKGLQVELPKDAEEKTEPALYRCRLSTNYFSDEGLN